MSYTALARKYRPQTFASLFGQDGLVQTLTNAVEMQRLHHAFIFTGTRGVGKTTTARIMALSLNCIGEDGQGKETITPCLKCKNCTDILAFRHPDIIEIDAASNTGVDFAREIIDSSKYPPMVARYKVYIIDEVHMLSKAAFNALLKTLEEPQHFVKFIFATTEFRKIPITISSRCQKFFLRNLSSEELVVNMKNILGAEGFKYQDEALELIAKMARGSARDSLSILDQVISMSGGDILLSKVREIFSSGDDKFAEDVLINVFSGDVAKALETSEIAMQAGASVKTIIADMADLITQAMEELCLKSPNKSKIAQVLEGKKKLSVQVLDRIWQVLANAASYSNINETAILKALVVRLSFTSNLPSVDEIVEALVR